MARLFARFSNFTTKNWKFRIGHRAWKRSGMVNVGDTEVRWTLAPVERELVMTKNRANRLGFAILLTFFRERGRFVEHQHR